MNLVYCYCIFLVYFSGVYAQRIAPGVPPQQYGVTTQFLSKKSYIFDYFC